MKRRILRDLTVLSAVVLACLLVADAVAAQDRVVQKTVNGIKHVLNPAEPAKGRVALELEKIREIDPYEHPEVGLRAVYVARADDGSLVLYDTGAEAHRFSAEGKYLGRLFREGQGPGEFTRAMIAFMEGSFIVTDRTGKLATFGRDGALLEEKRIVKFPYLFVNADLFLSEERRQDVRTVWLIHCPSVTQNQRSPVLVFEAQETWMHRRTDGRPGGFGNIWTTPNILYCYDPGSERIFVTLNKKFSIRVMDLEGKTAHVIEKPHDRIRLSRTDKEKVTHYKGASDNWMISACPNHLVALEEIRIMPKGFLAAFRWISVEESEIDVFDPAGRFVYTLALPDGIDLHHPFFFDSGIAGVIYGDETTTYVEYRIKNLPEIFR